MGLNEKSLSLLLLYSLIVGFFLGFLWDFFRIFRIICYGKPSAAPITPIRLPSTEKEVRSALSFKHRHKFFSPTGITVFISDLLFCTTSAFSVIILLFHLNDGEIRAFALFGAGIGFTVYYFTLGRITVRISDAIIKKVKKLLFFLHIKMIAPFFRLLARPFAFLLIKTRKTLDKIKNKIKIKKRSTMPPDEAEVTEKKRSKINLKDQKGREK